MPFSLLPRGVALIAGLLLTTEVAMTQAAKAANPDPGGKALAANASPEAQALLARAQAGDAEAMYWTGMYYHSAEGGFAKDDDESLRWLKQSAEAGYLKAQRELAPRLHALGRNAESFVWLKQLAELGDRQSSSLLGEYYEKGLATEKNPAEAKRWYGRAVELGDSDAMLGLARLQANAKDFAGARDWIKKAQVQGNRNAGEAMAALDKLDSPLPTPTTSPAPAPVLATPAAAPAVTSAQAPVVAPPELMHAKREFEVAYDNAVTDHERTAAVSTFVSRVYSVMNIDTFPSPTATRFILTSLLPRLEKNLPLAYVQMSELPFPTFDRRTYEQMASPAVRDAVQKQGDVVSENVTPGLEFLRHQEALVASAKGGDADAQYQLGMLYNTNRLIHDEKEAFLWFRRAAAQKQKDATKLFLSLSSQAYTAGDAALEKGNHVLAIAKFRYAASFGDPEATYGVGYLQDRGYEDVPPNPEAAIKTYLLAVDRGDTLSKVALGEAYLKGRGVKADAAEGVRWLRQVPNDPDAQIQLAKCYLWGRGVDQSESEAIAWFRKAAGKNLLATHWVILLENCKTPEERQAVTLGFACNAISEDRDLPSARIWLRESGQLGSATAAEWVAADNKLNQKFPEAEALRLGSQAYNEKKFDEAIALWRKAAAAGNRWAMLSLGDLYAHGWGGIAQDRKEALVWYQKAMDGGSLIGRLAIWQNESGQIVDEGAAAYKAQRFDEARTKFEKAATMGNRYALFDLGVMQESGDGMTMNLPKALALYAQASLLGSDAGEVGRVRVTNRLIQREVVERGLRAVAEAKYVEAMAHLVGPAEAGNSEAMTNLGFVYERLPTPDYVKAKLWYEKASALKYNPAIDLLQKLKAKHPELATAKAAQ